MNIQTINNVSDCVPLYLPHSLYLKPRAKFNISVQLPVAITGKTISNWDCMENLRNLITPDKFSVLKVSKSTLEIIRLDAEIEDRTRLKPILSRLDGNSLKISGYNEVCRIRASEARDNFPKRHDWDSYFRDARNMDEKKPGERPDTIHISNLPIRWFCPRHQENDDVVKPSESIFKRIFEKFGSVRVVDIPICDPFRKDMKTHMSGMKTFSFDQELYFEGYIQFSEYLGFVKAMDEFRGMKLVRKEGDKNLAISISVDFDTTKHLSEANIKRRQIIRDRLMAKEHAKRDEERRKEEEEEAKREKERQQLEKLKQDEYEKQRLREEKRKEKHLKKLREQEEQQLNTKIRSEEKKLLIAQRKLESIRLLEALFERIKLKNSSLKTKVKSEFDKSENRRTNMSTSNHLKTFDLRNKLICKVKTVQEQELERQKNRVKKIRKGSVLGTALDQSKGRSPSVNSISSDDSVLSDTVSSKKKKKKKASESSSENYHSENETKMNLMPAAPAAYPMYNPETGQWMNMNMNMGMGVYPFFPPTHLIRPDFFPNHVMPYPTSYRGTGYRGRFMRGRNRGGYRGRGGYHGYDENYKNGYDDYDVDHKRRREYRKRSNSRSRSRSDSRYSSRSRSRSHSRSRRSKSRSNRNRTRRSRSNGRSKLQAENKAKNLASTLRRSRSSRSSRSTRSRSSNRSWSSRSRSRSKHTSKSPKRNRSQDIGKDVKEQKHHKQIKNDSSPKKSSERRTKHNSKTPSVSHRTPKQVSKSPSKAKSRSRSRSRSISSSKFQSPKRKERSTTPEKEWN